jgi:hypothetical protein
MSGVGTERSEERRKGVVHTIHISPLALARPFVRSLLHTASPNFKLPPFFFDLQFLKFLVSERPPEHVTPGGCRICVKIPRLLDANNKNKQGCQSYDLVVVSRGVTTSSSNSDAMRCDAILPSFLFPKVLLYGKSEKQSCMCPTNTNFLNDHIQQ